MMQFIHDMVVLELSERPTALRYRMKKLLVRSEYLYCQPMSRFGLLSFTSEFVPLKKVCI